MAGSIVHALDPDGLVTSLGERVEVAISPRAQAAGVFWLLGLPLALFGAGYAAGARYFAAGGEGPAALLGIGGFALGIGAAALLQRGRRTASMPRVVKVLGSAFSTGTPCPGCAASNDANPL